MSTNIFFKSREMEVYDVKRTVFIVYGVFYYEGITILGVYDSFEKAQAAQEQAASSPAYECFPNLKYDAVNIDEREVK